MKLQLCHFCLRAFMITSVSTSNSQIQEQTSPPPCAENNVSQCVLPSACFEAQWDQLQYRSRYHLVNKPTSEEGYK